MYSSTELLIFSSTLSVRSYLFRYTGFVLFLELPSLKKSSASNFGGGEPPLAISSSLDLRSLALPFSRHSSANSFSLLSVIGLIPQVGALAGVDHHFGESGSSFLGEADP